MMDIKGFFEPHPSSMGRLSGSEEQQKIASGIAVEIAKDSFEREREYWASRVTISSKEYEAVNGLLDTVRRFAATTSCPLYLIKAANAVIKERNKGVE